MKRKTRIRIISFIMALVFGFFLIFVPFSSNGAGRVIAEESGVSSGEGASDELEGPDPNFHIFLAIGQSNMEGQGPIESQDQTCDERFLMMCTTDTANNNAQTKEWRTATPPLANRFGHLGVADYFGRTLVEKSDSNVRIGVVVVAVSGASIKIYDDPIDDKYLMGGQKWFTDRMDEYGGKPYQRLIECAKEAQKVGVIDGIIMHQGESDVGDNEWPGNVKNLYDRIVKDLNLGDDVPLLAGEVLRSGSYSGANINIAKLPQQSKNFYVVSSEGFNNILYDGQNIHFTSQEYRDFGKRYANKMIEVKPDIIKSVPTINVTDDGNGTGKASVNGGKTGTEVSLTAIPKEGYKFKEWQVVSGGVTIENNKFTIENQDIKIKAVFEKIKYQIRFEAGGGNGKMDSVTVDTGTDFKLPECGFTAPQGKTFDKWDIGEAGSLFTVSNDITITAVWKDKEAGENEPSGGEAGKSESSDDEAGLITTDKGYRYKKQDGTFAKNEWITINRILYYFNEDSYSASNEWIDGKWISADGSCTYKGMLVWKCNSTGWWVEDSEGWYPVSQWQKINGIWYYFNESGYMASNEYYNGYWFNSDGSWDSQYFLTWKSNSTGWWVEDKSGWWPSSKWLKIDGKWYYFDQSGYMVTSQYVDGYWINSEGVCE